MALDLAGLQSSHYDPLVDDRQAHVATMDLCHHRCYVAEQAEAHGKEAPLHHECHQDQRRRGAKGLLEDDRGVDEQPCGQLGVHEPDGSEAGHQPNPRPIPC